MKLTTGILTVAMVVGGPAALVAVGQNPDAIDNARSVAKALQQKQQLSDLLLMKGVAAADKIG